MDSKVREEPCPLGQTEPGKAPGDQRPTSLGDGGIELEVNVTCVERKVLTQPPEVPSPEGLLRRPVEFLHTLRDLSREPWGTAGAAAASQAPRGRAESSEWNSHSRPRENINTPWVPGAGTRHHANHTDVTQTPGNAEAPAERETEGGELNCQVHTRPTHVNFPHQ